MSLNSLVEIADRRSRKRAVVFTLATLVFLFVQFLTRPSFGAGPSSHGWRLYAWVVNAALLLLCLSTGGGILGGTRIRALINDEVSQSNYRTACIAGFWVAMVAGLTTYVVPALQSLTGQQVVYIVVALSTSTAMLVFAGMEFRAHADA